MKRTTTRRAKRDATSREQAREQVRQALEGDHGLDRSHALMLGLLFGVEDGWPLTRGEVALRLGRSEAVIANHEARCLAALGLDHLVAPLTGRRTYLSRPDGTPYHNDVVNYRGEVWWRTEDDMWTDGDIELTWRSLHEGDAPLRDRKRDRDMVPAVVLVHQGLVERDPLSLAIIARLLEGKFEALHPRDARRHALDALRRLVPAGEASDTLIDLAAGALGTTPDVVRRALGHGPAPLWHHVHPTPAPRGIAAGEVTLPSFAGLCDHFRDATVARRGVVYRWDWLPAVTPGGPDELVVHGVLTGTAEVFVLSCPVAREQEPEVLAWLRGPAVLGRVRELCAPLLDV